jgi:hypothetical protein
LYDDRQAGQGHLQLRLLAQGVSQPAQAGYQKQSADVTKRVESRSSRLAQGWNRFADNSVWANFRGGKSPDVIVLGFA